MRIPERPLAASSLVAQEIPAAPRSWMPSTVSAANSSRQHSISSFSMKGSPTCTLGRLIGPSSSKVSEARMERSEEHTSELQSRGHLVCRLLLEKKKYNRGSLHAALLSLAGTE